MKNSDWLGGGRAKGKRLYACVKALSQGLSDTQRLFLHHNGCPGAKPVMELPWRDLTTVLRWSAQGWIN